MNNNYIDLKSPEIRKQADEIIKKSKNSSYLRDEKLDDRLNKIIEEHNMGINRVTCFSHSTQKEIFISKSNN